MALNDRVLGVCALVLAAFLTWQGYGLQAPFAYEPVGPRAFPLLLAFIIALCGLRLVTKGGNPVAQPTRGEHAHPAHDRPARGLCADVPVARVCHRHGSHDHPGRAAVRWGVAALPDRCRGHGGLLLSPFDKVFDVVLPTGLLGDLL